MTYKSITNICSEGDCRFVSVRKLTKASRHCEEIEGASDGSGSSDLIERLQKADAALMGVEAPPNGTCVEILVDTPRFRIGVVFELKSRLRWGTSTRQIKSSLLLAANMVAVEHLARENDLVSRELVLATDSAKALLQSVATNSEEGPLLVTLDHLLTTLGLEHGSIWERHDNGWLTLEIVRGCPLGDYEINCVSEEDSTLVTSAVRPVANRVTLHEDVDASMLVNKKLLPLFKGRSVYIVRLGPVASPIGVAVLVGNVPTVDAAKKLDSTAFDQFLALEIQAKRRTQRLAVFSAIKELFRSDSSTLPSIAQALCEKLISIIHCQGVSIFLKENLNHLSSELNLVASARADNWPPSEKLIAFQKGKAVRYSTTVLSLTGSVARTSKAIVSNRRDEDRRNSRTFREVADETNQSWIAVPLFDSHKMCIGVLRCTGKLTFLQQVERHYIFNGEDAALLETAGTIIAPFLMQAHTAEVLQTTNRDLKDAEQLREHEMRGPLQIISDTAAFVKRYIDDGGVTSKRRRLESIQTNVSLCSALLTSTQLPDDLTTLGSLMKINVRSMLDQLAEVFRYQIEASSDGTVHYNRETKAMEVTCTPFMKVECMGNCPPILGHRDLLQRMFFNIGSNAIKYAKPKVTGALTIRVSYDNQTRQAVVTFEDEGIGIPSSEVDRIFQGGFRGERAKGKVGKGLGLKVARQIADLYSGTLKLLESKAPIVTTFECRFPDTNPV